MLVAGAGVVAFRYLPGSRAAARKSVPAVPVTIAPVVTKSVPVKLYAIGNVEPVTTVAVKAQVDGQIVTVKFKGGDEVKQGAVLFEIDRRPVRGAVEAGAGDPAERQKRFSTTRTEQEKRYRDLLDKKFISG